MAEDIQNHTRCFTWTHYLQSYKKGWILIYDNISSLAFGYISHIEEPSSDIERRPKIKDHKKDANGSLIYGYLVLSKLCAINFGWIPFFINDVRLGLYPTKVFAISSYFTVLIGVIVAFALIHSIFAPLVDTILPGIAMKRVAKLLGFGVLFTEVGYSTLGLTALAWMVYNRRFIQNFILFRCAKISLPKSYQEVTIIRIYVSISICSILAEPAFAFLTVYQGLQTGLLYPIAILCGASVISILQNIIPILNCFMICALAKHVEIISSNQIDRYYGFDCRKANANYLKTSKLPTAEERNIIIEYSTSTILIDWPKICDSYSVEATRHQIQTSLRYNTPQPVVKEDGRASKIPSVLMNNRRSLRVSGGLFLYKNLIKTLNDLKDLIRMYESVFGYYHVLLIHLNIVLVGQWVVVGIQQTRGQTSDGNSEESSNFTNPFVTRTCFGAFNFIMTNVFVFLHGDQLRLALDKLRNQLYKINLDLINDSSNEPNSSVINPFEINLIWSLYDSLERISREVNFRLIGNTYYSKHCLLFIFTRTTSLVLVYLQAIDIYKTI